MKKNIIPWIVLLLFLAAFVILMVEAYTYIENQKDAILLIVASVVLFLPNLWALTDYIALKIKNTRQKTGDGLREP